MNKRSKKKYEKYENKTHECAADGDQCRNDREEDDTGAEGLLAACGEATHLHVTVEAGRQHATNRVL